MGLPERTPHTNSNKYIRKVQRFVKNVESQYFLVFHVLHIMYPIEGIIVMYPWAKIRCLWEIFLPSSSKLLYSVDAGQKPI